MIKILLALILTMLQAQAAPFFKTKLTNGSTLEKNTIGYTFNRNGTTLSAVNGQVSFGFNTNGSLGFSNRKLQLSGDVVSPGNSKYYGTDGSGTKGYFTVSAGSGDVTGGSSSVINGIPMYSATTGKAITYSGVNILTRSPHSIYIGNGSSASTANGTSLKNTALGFNAMKGGASFTGDNNTAIGMNGLVAVTTGQNNTAIGYNAMYTATSAGQNVGLGVLALGLNTSGGANTGVGYQALTRITGTSNTGIGNQAMVNNVTGARNTAVGDSAGDGTSSNSFNNGTFLGYQTGLALTTGHTNTFLGYQAGPTTTTGSRNILIGVGVDTPSVSSWNRLNIGNTIYSDMQNGSVGICMATPAAQLHVNGSAAATKGLIVRGAAAQSANLTEWQNSAGTVLSAISNGGKLGVGTGSPSALVHISGITGNVGYSFDDLISAAPKFGVGTRSAPASYFYFEASVGKNSYNTTNRHWHLDSSNKSNMIYATNGGLIGIDTASPTAKLTVNGTTFTKGFNLNGNTFVASTLAQGSLLVAKASGAVQELVKGTNHYALKVNGNRLAWEVDATAAGGSGDVTGSSSSVVNGIPLYSATTGKAIKYGSVNLITRSQRSLYIGNGSAAYIANGTTLSNTALGYDAMKGGANFIGDFNTAMGDAALTFITAGAENTAMGYASVSNTTTGGLNTGGGSLTLRFNSTGNLNTAFGARALYNPVTGSRNTAVGAYAGEGNGSNSFSNGTFLGYQTGLALTTGHSNTFLGHNAGLTTTTGSRNIIIGTGADTPAVSSWNRLNIGNTIYSDMQNGSVGICMATPAAQLHVNGSAAATKGVIVKGAAAQSANLQEWQNSAGTVLASVSNGGGMTVTGVANLTGGINTSVLYNSFSNRGRIDLSSSSSGAYSNLSVSLQSAGGVALYARGNKTISALGNLDVLGNTGLGTISPTYRLHVNGTTATVDLALSNGAYATGIKNIGNGGTAKSLDCTKSMNFQMLLNATTLTAKFTPKPLGPTGINLYLTQGAGGTKAVTWNGNIHWAGGTAPTLSTVAGKIDMINCRFMSVSNGNYFCTYAIGF